MSIWLIGWAFGEVTALGGILGFSIQGFGGPSMFMIVWLAGWTVGGCYAIYILCWQLTGKELIRVAYSGITTSRSIFGIEFLQQEYTTEYIKGLRVSSPTNNSFDFGWSRTSRFYGMNGGSIAFDYGAKTVHFGIGIDEAEAKQVLAEIQQRYPQYRAQTGND